MAALRTTVHFVSNSDGQAPPGQMPMLDRRLSLAEKERLIQRAFHGLYRWYCDRSQTKRNWNADRSFEWRQLSTHYSDDLIAIVEGLYAVEQYAPDYTAELARLTRQNYGRSHFQLRWGAEEERHADVWRNVLLFSQRRSPRQIEQFTDDLRANRWTLPFESPLHMLLYTVFQERATQLTYMNLARVACGESSQPQFAHDADPVLAQVCRVVSVDEAAHFDFFVAGAQLYLYYFPEETLQALVEVLRQFRMPAAHIVPNFDAFVTALYRGAIFGPRVYARSVVPAALSRLGVSSIREIERHLLQRTPTAAARPESPELASIQFSVVESSVSRLFERIRRFETETGLFEIHPTQFAANTWGGELKGETR